MKIPESVLVVIHTPLAQVLMLERVKPGNFWQSVTGSRQSPNESFEQTCRREVMEETGIDADHYPLLDWHQTNRFALNPQWRQRFATGVTHNEEHVFGLQIPAPCQIILSPSEHLQYRWLPCHEAIDICPSWSNKAALRQLACDCRMAERVQP